MYEVWSFTSGQKMHCVRAQQGCNDTLVVRDGTVDDACSIMGILGMRTSFQKTRVTQLYLVLLPRYILATRTATFLVQFQSSMRTSKIGIPRWNEWKRVCWPKA